MKAAALNRKAHFDVEVEQRFKAGLILTGDEIKSIRAGRMQLTGSYIRFLQKGPAVVGLHLSLAKEPERSRFLLLHAEEVKRLQELLQVKGKVAVPLEIFIEKGWAKLTIGVGVGRKKYDKRELLKKRDLERQEREQLKR